MPKRKTNKTEENSDSDSDVSLVDVDFDFCDLKPEIDYIATKRLLQQLFHTDSTIFDIGAIADVILSEPDVGSTIKTDGIESDPLSIFSVINLYHHRSTPAITTLIDYILQKISGDQQFHHTITTLLSQSTDALSHVGLIIGERVYNMPPQVMPPLYDMLLNEIESASDDQKPYNFSHYLILSRIWRWTAEENEEALHDEAAPPSKRRKTGKPVAKPDATTNSYHPEDESIQKFAIHTLDYDFSRRETRDENSFGTDIAGRVMLIASNKLVLAVQDMAKTFPPPS